MYWTTPAAANEFRYVKSKWMFPYRFKNHHINLCQLQSPRKLVQIKTITCIVIFNKTHMRYDSISLFEAYNLFLETMEKDNWNIMITESGVIF
jgi:hypothetical protein